MLIGSIFHKMGSNAPLCIIGLKPIENSKKSMVISIIHNTLYMLSFIIFQMKHNLNNNIIIVLTFPLSIYGRHFKSFFPDVPVFVLGDYDSYFYAILVNDIVMTFPFHLFCVGQFKEQHHLTVLRI